MKAKWVTGLAFLALVVLLVWYFNRGYGEIGDSGYQLVKSIYSICNQQDETRLQKIEEIAHQRKEDGELPGREWRWVSQILEQAKRGDWEGAQKRCRQLMNAQIRQ